mmetsp:Transcript_88307/g.189638  ORF Transcript_88307/g.189638 Transcript_88307/m.189638 type:complete len:280 (-) Transcript_88307:414-1253(-)
MTPEINVEVFEPDHTEPQAANRLELLPAHIPRSRSLVHPGVERVQLRRRFEQGAQTQLSAVNEHPTLLHIRVRTVDLIWVDAHPKPNDLDHTHDLAQATAAHSRRSGAVSGPDGDPVVHHLVVAEVLLVELRRLAVCCHLHRLSCLLACFHVELRDHLLHRSLLLLPLLLLLVLLPGVASAVHGPNGLLSQAAALHLPRSRTHLRLETHPVRTTLLLHAIEFDEHLLEAREGRLVILRLQLLSAMRCLFHFVALALRCRICHQALPHSIPKSSPTLRGR